MTCMCAKNDISRKSFSEAMGPAMEALKPFMDYLRIPLLQQLKSLDNKEVEVIENMWSKCNKMFPVGKSDMMHLIQLRPVKKDNVKCFYACAFMEYEIMDEKGVFQIEDIKDIVKQGISKRPELMDGVLSSIDSCKYVNGVNLDGNKHAICERAAMGFNCTSAIWKKLKKKKSPN